MNVQALPILWLSEVKLPGKDLPANELWQLHEKERMSFEDYQKIIDEGYTKWVMKYLREQAGNPLPKLLMYKLKAASVPKRMQEAGIPIMNGASIGSPIEGFCGARQMMNFFMDIMEEPEIVKEAMDKAMPFMETLFSAQIKKGCVGAWVGGWRAAPQLMSHDTFMEFVWPYLKRLILLAIEKGVTPVLHFDSNWERELETLKELPERKCILMLDGSTDMRKAREVLDDRMCLMGDVPSRLLAYATPDEVYNYTTKLIDDVGHNTGLIVSSGCDCPLNAKDENVDAMIQATIDYSVG
jgi:uroporphyrinogen-III decarboxylase